ncbi:TraI domain-containing protein [Motilimonas cestriensis]|uniref:TraI domain-containing protein n=1 Tax=Motilimonas cestriensis TaxID=2742685 RepID=A0ABS8WG95_9GAMM|nr:MobH family relaxase [Motilimonas cestriensis]MCE2597300.1 TraI domain-containing protein [Motilimonas cestriensis]
MKTRGERFEEFLYKIGLIPWIGRQLGLIEIDSGDFLTAKELMAFPPATHGTPTQKVEEILASVEPLLKKIKHEAGIDDRLQTTFNFHNLYLDVIRNYATYIHLLPASENWHHSEHGGLLYHSLETSLEALKVFNNAHFRRYHTADIEVLRKPRWKYATWLAALLHDAGKPISDCRVICMKKGIVWPPHMMSLLEWAKLHKVERYKVAWKPERIHKGHESLAIHMLPKILTEDAKRFLTDGPDDVYEEVGRVLSNLEHSRSDIAAAVRTADSKSTARNIQKTWDRQLGEKNTSTVMLIVKGLRAKLSEWVVNEPKGHVWIINKEVYLAWPKAIQEVIEYLRKKEVVVPADTNTVYNMLYENHIIRNPDKDSKTTLFLPGDYSEDDAIKLRDGNVPVQWEFLVRVVWADYVFEGVPMPNTMNGILKLNKNFDMILVNEKGPTEIPAPAPQDNGQAQNNNQSTTPPAQSQTNSNQSATPPAQSQANRNQSATSPAQSQANRNQSATSPAQSQANRNQSATSPAQSQANRNQSATSPAQSQANNNQPATPQAQSQANNNQPAKSRKSKQKATPANQAVTQVKSIKQRKPKSKPSENDTSPFNPVAGTNFSELVANPPVSQVNNAVETDDDYDNDVEDQVTETEVSQEAAQVEMYYPSEQIKQIKDYLDAHPENKSIVMEADGVHYISPITALKAIPALGQPKQLMDALQNGNEIERRNPELITSGGITCNAIRLTAQGAEYLLSKQDNKKQPKTATGQQVITSEPVKQKTAQAKTPSEATQEGIDLCQGDEAPVDLEGLMAALASLCTPETTATLDGRFYVSIDIINQICRNNGNARANYDAIAVVLGACKGQNHQVYNEIKPEYLDRFEMTENDNG